MTHQPLVLIADDDDDVLELVAFRLRRSGYRTITARDGRESLALARAEHPDVAVLDIAMPQMDGLEVTRRVRGDGAIRDLPIILLTARSQERDVRAGIEAGADAYIRKPFSHRELRARVESLLAEPVAG
ncbi:MAG: response regulator [Actinobacteria bacterium]|nr:response regulator [Dehalococcoidia bacterium]MCB0873830.1 response regulator [Thermoleophilia bacterium]MCB9011040.1 response regulator [Actinomycetota bacterium]